VHLGHAMHTGTPFVPLSTKTIHFGLALKPLVF
jgi:hypothetical protein